MTERRRGTELENALLDAAWEELHASGLADLTMDAVATRAGTSRTVLYRRWSNKNELVRDALARALKAHRPADPDTGTLRGDLIATLEQLPSHRDGVLAAISVQLRDFFASTGITPDDMRKYISGEDPTVVETIYARAIERGEVDPAKLTDRIMRLPFILMRDEIMRGLGELDPDAAARAAKEIVDDIVLPLVTRVGADAPGPA